MKAIEQQAQQQQLTQSQIAQTRFYKNLTNKKVGPLAAALKKDTGNGPTAAALQALANAQTKDPSGASLNVDMISPHECNCYTQLI